jgi:hypothetical protein
MRMKPIPIAKPAMTLTVSPPALPDKHRVGIDDYWDGVEAGAASGK